jgi:hypothetical protein
MGMEILFRNAHLSNGLWEFPTEDFLVLARSNVPGLYILNPSARLIWEDLKAGAVFADLVRKFASTYNLPQELAAQDVKRTLDEWRTGLLSRQSSSSAAPAPPSDTPISCSVDFYTRDYVVHGRNVRIILQTFELTEEIAPRLESLPGASSTPDVTFRVVEDPDGFRIFRNECCVASEATIGETRGVLLQEIVRSCRGRDPLAIFHAGACGSSSRCVIFPASTQSGKTTLAAVLMKMGLTFYGDDSVLLERDTLSVPVMPFALTVREGSWDVLIPRFPALKNAAIVPRFGQRVRFLPPAGEKQDGYCEQVSAIVFARFNVDSANEIAELDSLQILLRLQQSGFWVAHDQQSIRAFLSWIESTAAFALSYSDVDQAASIIRGLVA